ncbi:unnamed protein product [Schistocephalus solidus]|uniref:Uncharacterized protein n=1 Tax=Schistocephalus solidus TaxID=70667 RepID=A0A3P7D057_SCHSO|nr:unnamed protein product [Schistocephalus solidus]
MPLICFLLPCQFVEIKTPDGTLKKVPSGLVDNTNEWLGDQFTSLHLKMTNYYDWTMEGFAESARKRMLARNKRRQMISTESIQHLGLDLAVAHMICNLGGRVQFVGSDRWFQRYNHGPSELPNCYAGDLKLEAIDASGTPIIYEGFKSSSFSVIWLLKSNASEYIEGGGLDDISPLTPSCLYGSVIIWSMQVLQFLGSVIIWSMQVLQFPAELTELRYLRLRRCVHVDDHCLSLVGLVTKSPLQLLDLSECPRITANGITALTELKSLRKLLVHGNPTLEDREFVCLLLEDYLPKVYIEGVDYLGQLSEEQRQRVLSLSAPSPVSLLPQKEKASDSDPAASTSPDPTTSTAPEAKSDPLVQRA